MRNKKGSTAVLLAVSFSCLAISVFAAVVIARRIAVASECEVFGTVWTKAVLSEYDLHLLEDYGIMAYQGPDFEIEDRLYLYFYNSISDKLGITREKISVELTGYEMSDTDNFKEAINKSFVFTSLDEIISGRGRMRRTNDEEEESKYIGNDVVTDTLPSAGYDYDYGISEIADYLRSGSIRQYIIGKASGAAVEIDFINKYLDSHLYRATDKDSYFTNEWEYIIGGKYSDKRNLEICRTKIFMIRNALNYACLSKDPEKQALLLGVSEIITPGPMGAATKVMLTEAWAAFEAEYDVQELLKGNRIPLIKTDSTWHTDLDGLLGKKEVRDRLDDEAKELLDENREEISGMSKGNGLTAEITDGQTYEDYLMVLTLAMSENIRLLRIMDIVQIDMKYRYYSDFNFEEYYNGVRFNVRVNGKNYEFEDSYK